MERCFALSFVAVWFTRTTLFPASNAIDLTVATYGLTPTTILSSLPFVGPAFDMGIEVISAKYNLSISHVYLSPATAKSCSDVSDQIDFIAQFYYRYSCQKPLIFALPGQLNWMTFVTRLTNKCRTPYLPYLAWTIDGIGLGLCTAVLRTVFVKLRLR